MAAILKKQHIKSILTLSRHEANGGRNQEAGVEVRSIYSPYVNPEMVVRVRAQVHLIEDGSDVVLEETIESPRHLQRTAEKGESSSKLAVVVRVAQVKLHVSTCEESLLRRNSNSILQYLALTQRKPFLQHESSLR